MTTAADEYLKHCKDCERLPDVFEFLAAQGKLSQRDQVDVLLVDQFQRWKSNQVIPVTQYFDRTPGIGDVNKVDLLIEEFGYLEQRGIAPTAVDFANRYSSLSSDAKQELFEALEIDYREDSNSSGSASSASDSADAPANAAQSIGRYQIVRPLGKGSFGKVYLAKDPDLDRNIAIKVPTDKRVKMGGGVEEFLNEARAVAKLDHPNIVPVYDVGTTDDDRCFVVSKHVRGKELSAEIRKGISHRESAWIIECLARALHVAHVAGIVHRDVKPSNVIIDSKRCPHLLDFGLAYRDQDDFDGATLVGTPAYMSPEQAAGKSNRVDGRSDIYSLGVVFYEMLTGHRPCKSDKATSVLEHLKQGEVRPPRQSDDTIPAELETICLKALSRQLSDRFNTAKDMADAIENWLLETSSGDGSFAPTGSGSGSSGSFAATRSTQSMTSSIASTIGSLATFQSPLASSLVLLCAVLAIGTTAVLIRNNDRPDTAVTNSLSADRSSNSIDRDDAGDVLNPHTQPNEAPLRVAVLGFRNLSAEGESERYDWIDKGLTDLLSSELQKTTGLKLVSPEAVRAMLADLELSASEALPASTLQRIDQHLGADWVIAGSYAVSVDDSPQLRFSTRAQCVSTANSDIVFTNTAELNRWLDLLPLASARLRRDWQLSAPDVTETGQLFPSAPNLSAAPDYYKGLALLDDFDPLAARESLKSAAQLDPESGIVFGSLAEATFRSGDEKLAIEYSEKAVAKSAALPTDRRLKILGRHHFYSGRYQEEAQTYRQLFEHQGQQIESRLLLAASLTRAGQGVETLALLEEIDAGLLSNATQAEIALERGKAAQSIADYARQAEFSEAAIDQASKSGARQIEGDGYLLRGQALARTGQQDNALVCFEKANSIFQDLGRHKKTAQLMAVWGKALINNSQLGLAEQKINEGLKLSDQIGSLKLSARLNSLLGEAAIYRGKIPQAIGLLKDALAIHTELGDQKSAAGMKLTIANLLGRGGKVEEAFQLLAEAREVFQATGDRHAEANTWAQEGGIRARTGDTLKARRYLTRALELFREVGTQRSIAICLGDLATACSTQGELETAAKLYSESLELHRQIGSRRGPELIMFSLSNLYLKTGRFEQAFKLRKESLQRYEQLGIGLNAIPVKRSLTDIQVYLGDLAGAKATLEEVESAIAGQGKLSIESKLHNTLAEIAFYEGDFDAANRETELAREMFTKLARPREIAMADFQLARFAIEQGDAQTAIGLFNSCVPKLISLTPEMEPLLLFARSRAQALSGDLTAAQSTLATAERKMEENETEDLTTQVIRLHERALVLSALGQTESAIEQLATVIDLAHQYGWVALEWEATVKSLELSRSIQKPIDFQTIETLKSTLTTAGFTGLADRLTALQN